MNTPPPSPALARLAELRAREVEQRQTELAQRLAEGERHRRNQERLDALWRTSTSGGTLTPTLSLNSANYKQTVLELANRNRDDMALHEEVTEAARHALLQATRRQGAIDQVVSQRLQVQIQALRQAEQKRQDEIARQTWLRQERT